MQRRAYALLVATAVIMGALCFVCSIALDYPVRDPDSSFLGPSWVKIPLLLLVAFLADLIPRTLYRAKLNPARYKAEGRALLREHWTRERITLVIVGLVCFYITYISYRNLKSMLVFFRAGQGGPRKYDYALDDFDRWATFGSDPAHVLHAILGTGISAHVLAAIYLLFLPIVPVSIVVWAVWSRNISFGYWFITSSCLAWAFGTASYYLVPTMGPNFFFFWRYADLPDTGVTALQDSLWHTRQGLRFHPLTDSSIQSVAGFASLHVGITVTIALIAHYTFRGRWLKVVLWVWVGLTAISTTYFGWHYLLDDVGGLVIAISSVYLGALATGQKFTDHGAHTHPTTASKDVPIEAEDVPEPAG